TSGANVSEIAFFALPHRPPTELHRSKPLLDQLSTDALRFDRCVAEKNGRIGSEFLAKTATEKLVNWPAGRLAQDVPQGDRNAAHGLDDCALPAEINCSRIHSVNEPVDL